MPQLVISKTYADDDILFEVDLDNIRNDLTTFFNTTKIDSDNIQDAGIETAKLQDSSVTTSKINDGDVTKDKLASDAQAFLVPTAGVLPYAGSSAPSGFLICDGSAVDRTTFADLFAVIGETHGNGNGTTTFNIPDYRGRFLRGVDSGAGRDPDAGSRTAMGTAGNTGDNVGSVQADELDSHNHSITDPGHTHANSVPSNTGGPPIAGGAGQTVNTATPSATTGVTINNTGGNETRPINANVTYIIKT